MRASIITPTNNPRWLDEVYRWLAAQTHADWEWLLLPNGGVVVENRWNDPRVRVLAPFGPGVGGHVGALKLKLANEAVGDFIVELDHDDFLHPEALKELAGAFASGADFAYSNFAEFHEGTRAPREYPASYGWRYRDNVGPDGNRYREAVSFPAEPPFLLYLTHSPNHVRAWSRGVYRELGGHDPALEVGDDFDLLIRTYLAGKRMVHIDKCLYYYRWTEGANTTSTKNARIQEMVAQRYQSSVYDMVLQWSASRGLPALDLGAAHGKPGSRWKGVDVHPRPGVDHVADLSGRWPFATDSVGVLRAWDFIEHIADKVTLWNEMWRVLAPGGYLMVEVPSSDGRGADQDPTHVARYNENSFWYFTQDRYKDYVPAIRCAFHPLFITTYFPSDFHKQHNISYVRAHLYALKPGCPSPLPFPTMTIPGACE